MEGFPGICMIGIQIEDLPIDFTAIDAMTPSQKSWVHEYEPYPTKFFIQL